MKIKTSELNGAALDWAVARCEGWDSLDVHTNGAIELERTDTGECLWLRCFSPSTDWGQGGPIIDREKYESMWLPRQQVWYVVRKQHGTDGYVTNCGFGPTLLIAAMRCHVASKLGNEVDIPEELVA